MPEFQKELGNVLNGPNTLSLFESQFPIVYPDSETILSSLAENVIFFALSDSGVCVTSNVNYLRAAGTIINLSIGENIFHQLKKRQGYGNSPGDSSLINVLLKYKPSQKSVKFSDLLNDGLFECSIVTEKQADIGNNIIVFWGQRVSEASLYDSVISREFEPLLDSNKYLKILIVKPNGRIIACNNSFLTKFGLRLADILNKNFKEVIQTDYAKIYFELIKKTLTAGKLVQSLSKIGDQNYRCTAFPIKNNDVIEKIIVVFINIQNTTQLDQNFEESMDVYHAIFDNAARTMLIIDPKTFNIVEANKSALNLYGYTFEELRSKAALKKMCSYKTCKEIIQTTLTEGSLKKYGLVNVKKDGTKFFCDISTSKLIFKGKDAVLFTVHDTTFHIQSKIYLEKYLRRLKNKVDKYRNPENGFLSIKDAYEGTILKSFNSKKDGSWNKFISIFSHDLRAQLSNVVTASDMLEKYFDKLEGDELQFIASMINKNVRIGLEKFEDLHNWLEIVTNKIKFKPKRIVIADVIDDVLKKFNKHVELKRLVVSQNVNNNVFVMADPTSIEQVVKNIISNSIKFTPKSGEITIQSKKDNKGRIQISIKDSGVGFDVNRKNNMFKINNVNSEHGTEGELGTGMGLIIAKKLMEMNKGGIQINSQINQGTRVKLLFQPADV